VFGRNEVVKEIAGSVGREYGNPQFTLVLFCIPKLNLVIVNQI
jgi:hypothetical protein